MNAEMGTKPKLQIVDGRPMTTSLTVAEHFGKRHKNVLRDIEGLRAQVSEDFGRLNFEPSSYLNEQKKPQPMYRLSRDGFAMLAMGFTGTAAVKWKEAYIRAFSLMERRLLDQRAADTASAANYARHALAGYETVRDLLRELHDVLRQSVDVMMRLHQGATSVTGLDEVGLALQLTGWRVPDAQLYVTLVHRSHSPRAPRSPQWVRISCRQLAADLGWSTTSKVRAALDRLRTAGLVEIRHTGGKQVALEYRADPAHAQQTLARLREQAVHVAGVRAAFALRSMSPLSQLVRDAVPRLDGTMFDEVMRHNVRWTTRRGDVAAALMDRTEQGLAAWIRALELACEAPPDGLPHDESDVLVH
jgi:Rha family phage regulatory protein